MILPESIIIRTATNTNLFLATINPAEYCHHSLVNNNIIATSISIMPSSTSSATSTTATTVVPLAVAAAAVIATTSIATIIGLIGGYYYRSVTSIKHREMKTLKVPKDLLKSEYNEELKLAIQLAMEGTFDVYTVTLLYVTLRCFDGKERKKIRLPSLVCL